MTQKAKNISIWPFVGKIWYNQIVEHLSDHEDDKKTRAAMVGVKQWNWHIYLFLFHEAFLKWAPFKKQMNKQTLISSGCLHCGSLLLSTDKCNTSHIIASQDWESPKIHLSLNLIHASSPQLPQQVAVKNLQSGGPCQHRTTLSIRVVHGDTYTG